MQNYLASQGQPPEQSFALAPAHMPPIEVLPAVPREYEQFAAVPREFESFAAVQREYDGPVSVQKNTGYSTVHVHVREQSYTATNDPGFVAGCPDCARMARREVEIPKAVNAGGSGGKNKDRARKRKNVASWICVGQLAAIIWLIGFQKLHVDLGDIVGVLKDNSARTTASVGSLISNNIPFIGSAVDLIHDKKPEMQLLPVSFAQKNSNSSKRRISTSHVQGFSWPSCKLFIPPPPPTAVSMAGGAVSTHGIKVPPPPKGFPSILAAGPGAVAASTLPPGSETGAREEHSSAVGFPHEGAKPEASPFFELDPKPAVSAAPVTAPGTIDSAMPDPAETIASSDQAERFCPQQVNKQPSRTVMAGRRKRTVVDR